MEPIYSWKDLIPGKNLHILYHRKCVEIFELLDKKIPIPFIPEDDQEKLEMFSSRLEFALDNNVIDRETIMKIVVEHARVGELAVQFNFELPDNQVGVTCSQGGCPVPQLDCPLHHQANYKALDAENMYRTKPSVFMFGKVEMSLN